MRSSSITSSWPRAVLFRDGDPTVSGLSSEHVGELAEAVKDYDQAWKLLQRQRVERARTDEEREREQLLLQLRIHASTNRGWAYESRMDAMLDRLLEPLASLRGELGFAPADLPALWRAMRELVNSRIREHMEGLRELSGLPPDEQWIERVAERFGRLPEREPGGWLAAMRLTPQATDFYLINCADLRLPGIFRFTLDELVELWPGDVDAETVRTVAHAWSMLSDEYADIGMSNLPLDNPVVARPFVAASDDRWYLFCGWLTLHNPFGLIESALAGYDRVLDTYRDRRAEFLEERLAELLGEGLPGAQIERSLLSVNPDDGKEYENDVIAFISSYAIVAEAKSGGLQPDVRRGRGRPLRECQAKLETLH